MDGNPELALLDDGQCRIRLSDSPVPADLPSVPDEKLVIGFSSPKCMGDAGKVGPGSDVFFLGCLLYYFIARTRPLAEASDINERLPPPNIFHQRIPPELVAVACKATSPVIGRRHANVVEFSHLDWALRTAELRRTIVHPKLDLEVGREIHIGLLKGRSVAVNQDDLFVGYDESSRLGLFVVSDRVSISRYGTSDMASRCVRLEASRLWERSSRPLGLDDTQTVSASSDDTLDGSIDSRTGTLPGHISPGEGKWTLLRQMLDAANRRIGMTVEDQIPPGTDRPEGVMAATALALHLEDGEANYAFIGDSRIYLIREGSIARLTVDHNLCTQLIRMSRPLE